MTNIIDANGITVDTLDEIKTKIIDKLKIAYGDDINVASDSPDGQLVNIFAQSTYDLQNLLVQIYNSLDPEYAIGATLDQRVAINGIQRLGGTYTMTLVTVVVDRALTLAGLDAEIDNPDGTGYTVSDDQGNKWILATTEVIAGAGSYSLSFRAQNSGAVLTVPNTIITPITIVLGVTSVNNPTIYTTLGLDEETDASLRLRRQQSVSLASQGHLTSLLAEILNISGVTYAKVYENVTGAVDSDGIPSHSIWCVVVGGSDDDIAYAIYTKRNAGCGMKGAEIVDIAQVDGSTFQVLFDRVTTQSLYIEFDATSINGVDPIDSTYIKDQLVLQMDLGVNESVNVNDVATLIRLIDSNCLATSVQVSDDGVAWVNLIDTTAKNYQFTLEATNIAITEL